jgi:hypothetical protein
VVDRTTGAARFPSTAYLDLPAASAPATPASGKVRLYAKTDKSLYQKDDAGTETGLAGGGGGGGGDVTAAASFGNDNRLIRSDGTGKGVQASGVTVDDSNNLTGVASIGLDNAGLKIKDTDASHDVSLVPGTNVTANRSWTLAFGDADRTLTMSANTTLGGGTHSGTNTGDQVAATQAEQEAASSTTVFTSPGRQHYHPSAAKAWVNFNGTGTVAIRVSYNVSSITDNATGEYIVNFATAFSSASYSWTISGSVSSSTGGFTSGPRPNAPTASAFAISTFNPSLALTDFEYVACNFFGDQ